MWQCLYVSETSSPLMSQHNLSIIWGKKGIFHPLIIVIIFLFAVIIFGISTYFDRVPKSDFDVINQQLNGSLKTIDDKDKEIGELEVNVDNLKSESTELQIQLGNCAAENDNLSEGLRDLNESFDQCLSNCSSICNQSTTYSGLWQINDELRIQNRNYKVLSIVIPIIISFGLTLQFGKSKSDRNKLIWRTLLFLTILFILELFAPMYSWEKKITFSVLGFALTYLKR
jgi:cell division protein FtsB